MTSALQEINAIKARNWELMETEITAKFGKGLCGTPENDDLFSEESEESDSGEKSEGSDTAEKEDMGAELSAFCREVAEGKHEVGIPEKSGISESETLVGEPFLIINEEISTRHPDIGEVRLVL